MIYSSVVCLFAYLCEGHVDTSEILKGKQMINYQHDQGANKWHRQQSYEWKIRHYAEVKSLCC